jgi:hypothetical protein
VAAVELERGELLALDGSTPVMEGLALRAEPEPVYNVEVDGDHCYRVGQQGPLAYHASVGWLIDKTTLGQVDRVRRGPGRGASKTGNATGEEPQTGITLATDDAFTGDDPDLKDAAKNVPDYPGQYSIVIHGTTDGKKLAKKVGTGTAATWVEVKVEDVAAYVLSKGITAPIRLIACASGMLGDQSPAQKLANLTCLPVVAPPGIITINLDGSISPGGVSWPTFMPKPTP